MAESTPDPSAGGELPDVIDLKLTVLELGILTGLASRWASENRPFPAAERLMRKLFDASEPLYAPEEPHPR